MPYEATAWVLQKPGSPHVRERRTLRDPGPGESVVEVIGCGLCHTDLGYARGEVPTRKLPPLVLGHEVVGRVLASGEGPDAQKPGTLVVVPAVLPCGTCAFCAAGRANACPEQQMPGNDVDGGFATHFLVRSAPLAPLTGFPEGYETWKLGVVADAVSTAWQAVRRSGLAEGDVAVVVGAGGVGAFVVQVANALGAHVAAIDVRRDRLDLAASHGASDVLLSGSDVARALRTEVRALLRKRGVPSLRLRIFECTGTRAGQSLAFSLLDRGATLVQVGYTPEPLELRLSNLMAFDATVHGTWGCPPQAYPEVLAMVSSGAIQLDPFVERAPMSALDGHLAAMAAGRLSRRLVLDPNT